MHENNRIQVATVILQIAILFFEMLSFKSLLYFYPSFFVPRNHREYDKKPSISGYLCNYFKNLTPYYCHSVKYFGNSLR